MKLCPCGSGEPRRELKDARGIFCNFICDKCEDEKREEFRPDIFEDPNYWTDEPVDPEDYDPTSEWEPNESGFSIHPVKRSD